MGDFMNHGFVRVGAAVPKLKVANCEYNADNIIELILKAENLELQFVVFPELAVTAYTCGDLFHQQRLLEEAGTQLARILEKTADTGIVAVIGLPVYMDSQLFNCAAVIQKGKLLGVVPKSYIPNYKEYYEERWFAPGTKALNCSISLCGQEVPFGVDILFEAENRKTVCFGIEICEDLWVPIPPSSYQALAGATLLFNLSASNESIGKHEYRRELVKQQSARCVAAYAYASSGVYESTTDVVFGGHCLIGENGGILAESQRFKYDNQLVFTEVDIDRLVNDRLKNTSFM
jgi:NAD+ synthase (glutamine-hydrolysing)